MDSSTLVKNVFRKVGDMKQSEYKNVWRGEFTARSLIDVVTRSGSSVRTVVKDCYGDGCANCYIYACYNDGVRCANHHNEKEGSLIYTKMCIEEFVAQAEANGRLVPEVIRFLKY